MAEGAAKQWIWGAAIGVLALVVRLVYLGNVSQSPGFGFLTYSSVYYHQFGLQLASNLGFTHEVLFKAPLYPFFISLVYAWLAPLINNVLFVQSVLGALSCVLVYTLALRLYTLRVAVTAGLASALYGTLIYFNAELLPPTLFTFLALLGMNLLVMYEARKKLWLLFLAGLATGLAATAAVEALLFVLIVVFWVWRRAKVPRVRPSLAVGIFAIGALIVLIPFAIRNYSGGQETVPFLTSAAINFAIGNNSGADGFSPLLPGSEAEGAQGFPELVQLSHRANGRELPLHRLGVFWLGQGISYVVSHPLDWLALKVRKFAFLIMGYEINPDKPIYFLAKEHPPLGPLLWDNVVSFPFGLIMPLALLMPLGQRRPGSSQFLLAGFVVVIVLANLCWYVSAAHRVALVPILIIWAAAGFWGLIETYRAQDYARFYRWLSLLVVGVVVVNLLAAIPGLSPRVDSEFEGRLWLGRAYYAAGQYGEAETMFSSARRIQPRSPQPYYHLGNTYFRQNRDEEAIEAYRRSFATDPAYQPAYRGLASLYRARESYAKLNELVVPVIREHPQWNWPHDFYAFIHIALSAFSQAADIYERAFEADSTNFDAIFRKGECYLRGDMRVEAEEEFKRYLEYMPSSIDARANLAQVYARQRRLSEAIEMFKEVRRLQPEHPAAFFNLASAYFQAGDPRSSSAYLDTTRFMDPQFPGLREMRAKVDSALVAEESAATRQPLGNE